MSDNLKDTSGTLLDNTVAQNVSLDALAAGGEGLEFTDQDLLDYEEGTLTKGETAQFLLLSPLANAIIKFSLIGLGLIAAIFWLIAAIAPGFSNSMAGGFYKGFISFTAAINNIFPFSVFEILLILILFGWLAYLAFIIVRTIQVKKSKLLRGRLWIQFGYATLALVLIVTLFYSFGYGIAKNRKSFLTTYKDENGEQIFVNQPANEQALSETMLYIVDKMNNVVINTANDNAEEATGIFYLEKNGASRYARTGKTSTKALSKAVNAAFKAAGQDIPSLKGPSVNVKQTLAGPIYTSMGIGSAYSPLTGEVQINPYYPEIAVPFLVAKAIAKERGFQSDAQANLIAYLVCTQYSDVPYVQYSGYFNAYLALGGRLVRMDANMYATIAGTLRDSVKKEIIYYTMRIDRLYGNKNSLSYAEDSAAGDEDYLKYPKLMIGYYRNHFASYASQEESNFGLYVNCLINAYQKDTNYQTEVDAINKEYETPSVQHETQTENVTA